MLEACSYAVRTVAPDGTVSTFAGATGVQRFADGVGSEAGFRNPKRIAIDASDNLYVTDHVSLRRISPAGEVVTVAGNPDTPGMADGQGGTFNLQSHGIATDAAGNVYVDDEGRIRKVTPTGFVSTIVRFPPAELTPLGYTSMTMGSDGNLYLSNSLRHTIHRIAPDGTVSTVAGGHGRASQRSDGTGVSARFGQVRGLAAGREGETIALDLSSFLYASTYLSDQSASEFALRNAGPDGTVTTLASPAMDVPSVMASDTSGDLYFITRELQGIGSTRTGRDAVYKFARATGEVKALALRQSTWDGAAVPGQLYFQPTALAVDSLKNVYVANAQAIQRIAPAGGIALHAGADAVAGSNDGAAGEARFANITAMAVDAADNLYVADNSAIRKIGADGRVRTIAGVSGMTGSTDGTGAAARFTSPAALALDPAGNLYIADQGNYTIRRLAPDGSVVTLAGTAGRIGIVTGNLPGGLDAPTGIRFVQPNSLLVSTPNSILKIVLP